MRSWEERPRRAVTFMRGAARCCGSGATTKSKPLWRPCRRTITASRSSLTWPVSDRRDGAMGREKEAFDTSDACPAERYRTASHDEPPGATYNHEMRPDDAGGPRARACGAAEPSSRAPASDVGAPSARVKPHRVNRGWATA